MEKTSKVKQDKKAHVLIAIVLGIFVFLISIYSFEYILSFSFPHTLIPMLLIIIVSLILNRFSDYNYKFFLIAILTYIIMFLIAVHPG